MRMRRGLAAVILLGGCAGPPWYMGSPTTGQPSIPAGTAHPPASELHARAAVERAACRKVTELAALLALDEVLRLRDDEKDRLVCLLRERMALLALARRAIPRAADAHRVERLAPGAVPRAELAAIDRDEGDAWLAVGDDARARDAFERALRLGASDLEIRRAAARGEAPPSTTPVAELGRAVRVLPERAALLALQSYVGRGGRDAATLVYGARLARAAKRDELVRLIDEARAAGPEPAPVGVPVEDCTSDEAKPAPFAEPTACGACPGDPSDLDRWPLGTALLAHRLLPVVRSTPKLLEVGTRSRQWQDFLMAEDPTSPDALDVAATIDGLAGRFGGVERKLQDLVFFTPERRAGLERAARVWQRIGRPRQACAAWMATARWAEDPFDPAWLETIACTRRDPGAGDWRAVRRYVLDRAPAARRESLAAALDQAAAQAAAGR